MLLPSSSVCYDRDVLDLHNHVLFGLDDGCRTPEESTALAEAAAALGHTGFVATPHIRPGIFDNTEDGIRRRFEETRPLVEAAGLTLSLGTEYWFDERLLEVGRARKLLTLGDGSRYFLTEFPQARLPLRWDEVLYELRLEGYVAVIAHPERCKEVGERLDETVESFRRAGALLQLDLGSLLGRYGRDAKKTAEKLVKKGCYHVAAGDLHRPEDAAEILPKSKKALTKLLSRRGGAEALATLTEHHPRRILEDASPDDIPAV